MTAPRHNQKNMSVIPSIDIYIDASTHPQKRMSVVGYYIPAIESIELMYLPGYRECSQAEVIGYKKLSEHWPQIPGHTYTVHTDCNNLAKDLSGRDDIIFVKEKGHGKMQLVDPQFKIIDKAVRRALRNIVKAKNLCDDFDVQKILDHSIKHHSQ